MKVSRERAAWLGCHIFPHEAALRSWLGRRPAASNLELEDVVQEAYAILAALDRVDHIRQPRSYFFEVAKSVVLQSLRRRRVVAIDGLANAELLEIPSDAPTPERIAADREELAQVAALIAALPDRCREVFTWRKLHGLSQRETADRLAIAESTVEKHMVKALSLLTNGIGRGGIRQQMPSRDRDPATTSPRERSGNSDRD